ncbi:MAG: DUF4954 family protein [Bacteroidales bacterium]|nr:DUF4954 family protein [Bacteroidales bacterium]
MEAYRQLTPGERVALGRQECTALDWDSIHVKKDFSTDNIFRVDFEEDIYLGEGLCLRDAWLCDVRIGDNSCIRNAGQLSRVIIGRDCRIERVGTISCHSLGYFGQGVSVAVLNEGGGREVILHEGLTAQEAYIWALYRHDKELTDALNQRAGKLARQGVKFSSRIGDGAVICDCAELTDINVGEGCHIEGARRLVNGTLMGGECPAFVGSGVEAEDFIFADCSRVDGAASLLRCYVGQGCHIGRGFTATDSLFFANSSLENGEACSLFAGPFTVSHHKSTLLIAAMTSFYNAGSATNQSNHNYKLGPIHQGVFGRGVKTASSSYMLWPARVGAFSIVVGHHESHPDTADFPFSYLLPDGRSARLMPGAVLRSAGLVRDGSKWLSRDVRRGVKRDIVDPQVFSPYTMGGVLKALAALDAAQGDYKGSGFTICSRDIEQGRKLYRLALDRYLGDVLAARLDACGSDALELADTRFPGRSVSGAGLWVDIAGQAAPQEAVEAAVEAIKGGAEPAAVFASIATLRADWEWNWVRSVLVSQGLLGGGDDSAAVQAVLSRRDAAARVLADLAAEDAAREYDEIFRIGYGIDGDSAVRDADFLAVRGCTSEEHPLIAGLKKK